MGLLTEKDLDAIDAVRRRNLAWKRSYEEPSTSSFSYLQQEGLYEPRKASLQKTIMAPSPVAA